MKTPKWLDSLLDFLGMLGFTVRDSARFKRMQEALAAREWGAPVDGFSLSIEARPADSSVNKPVRLAVAARNSTGQDVSEVIPGWLNFLAVDLSDPQGEPVRKSPFGERAQEPSRRVIFPTDHPVQAELPLSELYELQKPGKYRAFVECAVPGIRSERLCRSNAVTIVRR